MGYCDCIGCPGQIGAPVVNGVEWACPCTGCSDINRAARDSAMAAYPNDPDWWMHVDYGCQICGDSYVAFMAGGSNPDPTPCPNCGSTMCWDGVCCCNCGLGCPGNPGPQPPETGPSCPWCGVPPPWWDPQMGWCWNCGYPFTFCACWGCTTINCECVLCEFYNEWVNAFGPTVCCPGCASGTYSCPPEFAWNPGMGGG